MRLRDGYAWPLTTSMNWGKRNVARAVDGITITQTARFSRCGKNRRLLLMLCPKCDAFIARGVCPACNSLRRGKLALGQILLLCLLPCVLFFPATYVVLRTMDKFEEWSGQVRSVDACELLTSKDVQELVRIPIERAKSSGRSPVSTCRYFKAQTIYGIATDRADVTVSARIAPSTEEVLRIEVHSHGARATMFEPILRSSKLHPPVQTFTVRDLGDAAIRGPGWSYLLVRKGDASIQVDWGMLSNDGQDAELAIAKRVLPRL